MKRQIAQENKDAELLIPPAAPDGSGIGVNYVDAYLKVLNKELSVVTDMKLGDEGFAHVHPSLARLGSRLFVAWSKRVTGSKMVHPQVFVEEFEIQYRSE